jgi:CheY-like chemotaxis protein
MPHHGTPDHTTPSGRMDKETELEEALQQSITSSGYVVSPDMEHPTFPLPDQAESRELPTATNITSAPAQDAPPPSDVVSSGEELEFLLVDDNPINLTILASYMKKLSHKYNTASNGQEAVDTYRQDPGRYSCIFMDISMPVMDGFEATRQIRAMELERNMKPASIFALSGLASADAQQEAFASGINLFLTKPVRMKELSSILTARGLI